MKLLQQYPSHLVANLILLTNIWLQISWVLASHFKILVAN